MTVHDRISTTETPATQFAAMLVFLENTVAQFGIGDSRTQLDILRRYNSETVLRLAILGRYNAGKSSFINSLLGRNILPVGAVPVTSVITSISYGPVLRARIADRDLEKTKIISLEEMQKFIRGREGKNHAHCGIVEIQLPEMERFAGLRIVDTPGLESLVAQNTDTTVAWTPEVDFALVAVAVDPPLMQNDIELIEHLLALTPNVGVLLTKVDLLRENERREVEEYVRSALETRFSSRVRIFPFSTRPSFERLREDLEKEFLLPAIRSRDSILQKAFAQKMARAFSDVETYLRAAKQVSEQSEADRASMLQRCSGVAGNLADDRLQLSLVTKNTKDAARTCLEKQLNPRLPELQENLLSRFRQNPSLLSGSFAKVLERFEDWLRKELAKEFREIALEDAAVLLQPCVELQRRLRSVLQSVRDRVSRELQALAGIVLNTSEPEMEFKIPDSPDVSIGRIFDHNWELVSGLVPMFLVRPAMKRRLEAKIADECYKNLSRFVTQWREVVLSGAAVSLQEAQQRLDEFQISVRAVLSQPSGEQTKRLRAALDRAVKLRKSLPG